MEFRGRMHLDNKIHGVIRFIAFAFFLALPLLGQAQTPEKWGTDFVIQLSHTGSMRGGDTHIKFTYDSCTYKYDPDDAKPVTYSFAMTDALRNEILTTLKSSKFDQIKSEGGAHAVNDGWSNVICVGMRCVESGPAAEMTEADRTIFSGVYNYLQQIALDKKKK